MHIIGVKKNGHTLKEKLGAVGMKLGVDANFVFQEKVIIWNLC